MTAPPPAWYPDPSGVAEQRYWNGSAWTPGVVIAGQVLEREMPWPPVQNPYIGLAPPGASGPVDDRIQLPPRAALYALAGFVAGMAAGLGLALSAVALDLPTIAVLLLNVAGLWTGLLGAVYLASRRWGTGNIVTDFGLRITARDAGWGFLWSWAARIGGGMLAAPIVAASRRFANPDQGLIDRVDNGVATYLVFCFVAVIGAPLVEELFFRGLLLRSLTSWIGLWPAISAQAVLFGLAHFSPLIGWANVTLIIVIGTGGFVFGFVAHRWGIGRSIMAHSSFNLVTVLAVRFLVPYLTG